MTNLDAAGFLTRVCQAKGIPFMASIKKSFFAQHPSGPEGHMGQKMGILKQRTLTAQQELINSTHILKHFHLVFSLLGVGSLL